MESRYPNIFQIWYGYTDEIPGKYGVFLEHNRTILSQIPAYRLITTSQIKEFLSKYGYNLEKFKNEQFRFQSDLIRFLILYHYGGLYLDLDIKLNDSFFELLEILRTEHKNRDLMPSNRRIYFLWFQKKSKNLKKIIDHYFSLSHIGYDYNIFSLHNIDISNLEFIETSELNRYLKHFAVSG